MKDYTKLTDDELQEILTDCRCEVRRRSSEKKLPVFIVDGIAHKSLDKALARLKKNLEVAENYKDGPEAYLKESIENQRPEFGLEIEHWSLSEYNARPDTVYGY